MTSIPVLPFELWLKIVSYLDYKDVLSYSYVNRAFNEVSHHSLIWKYFCKKYWLEEKCPSECSWKDVFISCYRNFGQYINCYRFLKKSWNDLLYFADLHCPGMTDLIQPGVSEDDLNNLEAILKCRLPNDYRCFYRIQNSKRLNDTLGSEIFGRVVVYDFFRSMLFIDLKSLLRNIPFSFACQKCVPLVGTPDANYTEFIPLRNIGELTAGYIYCTNFQNFLNGSDGMNSVNVYISGRSVTEWFTTYVDSLVKGAYAVKDARILRFYHEPGCTKRTHSIEVSASTVFMSELSDVSKNEFVHSYRITMTMDKEARADEACQLITRHWIITDENGKEERVDGRGVVGEYPILKPGVSYSWSSITAFKTTYGNMKGHFYMKNLASGVGFDLECPVFHMKCLPYLNFKGL